MKAGLNFNGSGTNGVAKRGGLFGPSPCSGGIAGTDLCMDGRHSDGNHSIIRRTMDEHMKIWTDAEIAYNGRVHEFKTTFFYRCIVPNACVLMF